MSTNSTFFQCSQSVLFFLAVCQTHNEMKVSGEAFLFCTRDVEKPPGGLW